MNAHDRAAHNLILQSDDPLNAEPAPDRLIASFLTPQRAFYIRSHGNIPDLAEGHRITINGLVEHEREWTKAALEEAFKARTVVAVMQCAGNRRANLQDVGETSGDPWGIGAIGNAEWTGVSLIDVLRDAGIDERAGRFVRFTGADEVAVDGETAQYGVSIPISKAVDRDVLIAWALNGEPLAPEHGAPMRIVVPGYAGVRSTKWLASIEIANSPSEAPIQAKDYKLFPASVSKNDANWSEGLTINEMPINAAICEPADGVTIDAGAVTARGYAVAYGRAIARVDISADGGLSWQQAEIERLEDARWSWVRWACNLDVATGKNELVVRAVDDACQGQPDRAEDVWNFAGYLATNWHRIAVTGR